MLMKPRLIAILTGLLLGLAGATRAAPVTWNFNFGTAASGQFTTDGAAPLPADAGYFLITSLKVLSFIDASLGPQVVSSNASVTFFDAFAMFNPTTGAFRNHAQGNTWDDIGQLIFTGSFGGAGLTIGGGDFKVGSTSFSIFGNNGGLVRFHAVGPLVVTEATVSEPGAAWLSLLALGAMGVVRGRVRPQRPALSHRPA